jgi:hypothetical protein
MRRIEKPNRRRVGQPRNAPSLETAIAIISQHRKALAAVGARKDVVASLDGALKLLKQNVGVQGDLFGGPRGPARRDVRDELDGLDLQLEGRDLKALSLDEIWEIITDDEASRKVLERIAIERFAVPKGSMRSFPNMLLLREKLMTLVRNDAAHNTISLISRSNDKG